MANEQNLKPWPKGVSGNPKGGAASRSIEKIFREFLFDIAKSKDGQERERIEVLMARLFSDGAQGNVRATETLLAYGFGKPAQAINLGGQDGENPVQVDTRMTVELVRPKESSND